MNIFVDWNYDMDDAQVEVPEGIAPDEVPENTQKALTEEDGDQPPQPEPREWDGVTVR